MKFVPNAVSVKMARQLLIQKKHSPETLFAAGLFGMGATIVLSCRATLKVGDILDGHEATIAQIESTVANPTLDYSAKDASTDRRTLTVQTGVHIAKLYAPAAITGILAVSALAGSHNILNSRNASIIAAYGALDKTFNDYRGRVRDSVGDEREREIYTDALPCEIEDEKGKVKKVKKATMGGSMYAKLFDEFNVNHNAAQPELNLLFLKLQQKYANQLLQSRGHVFLNEVYDSLGMERSSAGQIVGWVKGNGDDYIDFGVFNQAKEGEVYDLMVGNEKAIWLDFNVDGVVYNKI